MVWDETKVDGINNSTGSLTADEWNAHVNDQKELTDNLLNTELNNINVFANSNYSSFKRKRDILAQRYSTSTGFNGSIGIDYIDPHLGSGVLFNNSQYERYYNNVMFYDRFEVLGSPTNVKPELGTNNYWQYTVGSWLIVNDTSLVGSPTFGDDSKYYIEFGSAITNNVSIVIPYIRQFTYSIGSVLNCTFCGSNGDIIGAVGFHVSSTVGSLKVFAGGSWNQMYANTYSAAFGLKINIDFGSQEFNVQVGAGSSITTGSDYIPLYNTYGAGSTYPFNNVVDNLGSLELLHRTNATVQIYALTIFEENSSNTVSGVISNNLPADTGTCRGTKLIIQDDIVAGSVDYTIEDNTGSQDTNLPLNTENQIVNAVGSLSKLYINLNSDPSGTSNGSPSISSWALKVYKY